MPGSIRAIRRGIDPIRGRGRVPLSKRSKGHPEFRPTNDVSLSTQEKRIAETLTRVIASIPRESVLEAAVSGDLASYGQRVLQALTERSDEIQRVLFDSLVQSGEVAAIEIGRDLSQAYRQIKKADAPLPSEVALRFRFNSTDPRAVAWARQETGVLITNMVRSEQEAIRQIVTGALADNRSWQQTGRGIFAQLNSVTPSAGVREFADTLGSNLNGLTQRYEQAVINRVTSVADDLASRGITGTKALETMRKEGDKYATKLRRARSRTIARTERMRAHNQARLLSFQQAIDSGLASADHSRKQWQTGPFDVCNICVPMQGVQAKVADAFTLPNGAQVVSPPAHPNCRCNMTMVTDVRLYEPPQALGTGEPGDPFRIGQRQFSQTGQELAGRPLNSVPTPQTSTPSVPQPTQVAQPAPQQTVSALQEAGYGRIPIEPPDEVVQLWARDVAGKKEMGFASAKLRFNKSDEVQRWVKQLADDIGSEGKFHADRISATWTAEQVKIWERVNGGIEATVDYFAKYNRLNGMSKQDAVRLLKKHVDDFDTFLKEAKVSVQIHPSDLEQVLKEGRIKTQFETGKSSGMLDLRKRKTVELERFGMKLDEAVENRPIYGHMDYADQANMITDHYGSARVILKDEIKDRTTYTGYDSLLEATVSHPVNRPSKYAHLGNDGFPPSYGNPYLEVQSFGGVRTTDIAEVIFDTSTAGYKAPSQQLLASLDDAGIPYKFVKRVDQLTDQKYQLVEIPNPVSATFQRPTLNASKFTFDDFMREGDQISTRLREAHGVSWDIQRGNPGFVEMSRLAGFDAKPLKVVDSEWGKVLDDGWTPIYRGLNGESADDVAEYVAQFIDADTPFGGSGMFGSGHYASDIRETAEAYASEAFGIGQEKGARAAGEVLDLALHPDAKIIDYDDLGKEMRDFIEERRAWEQLNARRQVTNQYGDLIEQHIPLEEMSPAIRQKQIEYNSVYSLMEEDAGRFALARGYDAVRIKNPTVAWGEDALPDTFYAILNRGALAVRSTT